MDFTDDDVAALYDLQYPWDETRPAEDAAFYTGLVMDAASVLDVGCGTGGMLVRARELGHSGFLAGIDPDAASLRRARARSGAEGGTGAGIGTGTGTGIEWVDGVAADIPWRGRFELATMTGHAFQCLVTDEERRASLVVVRRALVDGGRFVFETRHPQARAWEQWAAAEPDRVVDARGRELVVAWEILSVADGVVTMTETTSAADGTVLHVGRGTLRFVEQGALNALLGEAGFAVEAQHGDWERGPITEESREIVTVARAV